MNTTASALVLVALFGIGALYLWLDSGESSPHAAVLVGLLAATIPAFVAARFAERASKDVRNGRAACRLPPGHRPCECEHEERRDRDA